MNRGGPSTRAQVAALNGTGEWHGAKGRTRAGASSAAAHSATVRVSGPMEGERQSKRAGERNPGNLCEIHLLLWHTKLESTVRFLGIEVDDALTISEQVEIRGRGWLVGGLFVQGPRHPLPPET